MHILDSSSENLNPFKLFLQESLGPNAYIVALRMGKNAAQERDNTYHMHPNKQVELACRMIAANEKLKNGYNAIGFSQAAQFL